MPEITLYFDEGVDIAISDGLKRRGTNTVSARDSGNLGLSDKNQLNFAIGKNFVFVTNDSDFLALVIKPKSEHHGIIYFEKTKYSVGDVIRKIEDLLSFLEPENFKNHIEFL